MALKPELKQAIDLVGTLNFTTKMDCALYVGPHMPEATLSELRKNRPELRTFEQTEAGQVIRGQNWFSTNTPFTLQEQRQLKEVIFKKFMSSATGNFNIVGLDPTKIVGESHLANWFTQSARENRSIYQINGYDKEQFLIMFSKDLRQSQQKVAAEIATKGTNIVEPNIRAWRRQRRNTPQTAK